MAFNLNSFLGFTNYEIIETINEINNLLNENIPIFRGQGAHRRNIKTLINYLNQHNAQEIINPNFNDDNEFEEGFDNFIIHEQESRKQEFHDKQVRDDYNFLHKGSQRKVRNEVLR